MPVAESTQSRRLSLSQNGERSRERVFTVTSDDTVTVSNPDLALLQSGVPERLDVHPEDPTMRADTYTVRPLQGSVNGWEVVWTYRTIAPISIVPGASEPADGDSTREVPNITLSVSAEFVDTWRVNVSVPAETQFPSRFSSSDDIGGWPVDSVGEPVSRPVLKQVLDVTQTYSGTSIFSTIAALTNKRNSTTFLGASPGLLLYAGADSTRVGQNEFEITHHFFWDEFAHLRQIVQIDTDGKPATTEASNVNGNFLLSGNLVGYPVWWVQPYPSLVSFASLQINVQLNG